MKIKLYRKILRRAYTCAHINSITRTVDFRGEYISGVSIGYGTYDNEPYKHIWTFGMTEETFNRKIKHIYWELNKHKYYNEYRKHKWLYNKLH